MFEKHEWLQGGNSSLMGTGRRGCRCQPDGQHVQAAEWQTWA